MSRRKSLGSQKKPKFAVLACVVIIITVFCWFLIVSGIPNVSKPVKDKMQLGLDIKGGVNVVLQAKGTNAKDKELAELMNKTKSVIENRIDNMGIKNPTVSVEGNDRIRVELPGTSSSEEAIRTIGKTAQLKFVLADGSFVLDGGDVKDAKSGMSQGDGSGGGYVVDLEFNKKGAKAFEDASQKALAGTPKNMMKETKTEDKSEIDSHQIIIMLDNEIISHPTVNEVISGGKCQISGNFSQEEAANLAALIKGGSLPVHLEEISSSSQTAQIGMNMFEVAVKAGLIGIFIVLLIMLIVYKGMGVAADLALLLYVPLVILIMAGAGNVLTLSGIAGIILSIGMAVDANVIIFERIKEEYRKGRSLRASVREGSRRALMTIIDSQVTTMIAAVIMYQIGTSSVKGFAWTLMIGIIVSIFTAICITQLYMNAATSFKNAERFLGVSKREQKTREASKIRDFHFIKHRKIYYAISCAVIATGLCFAFIGGLNYGIDFTGGTKLEYNLGQKTSVSEVKQVLKEKGLNTNKCQIIFTGDKGNHVQIKTQESVNTREREGINNAFKSKYDLSSKDIIATEHFGASVGKELQRNALLAIGLASLGMLIYIRLRFKQWEFGAAALLGVLHDALVVLSAYAIFRITVNNPFIAAILTVVGYSINDTIVIFDRVRENKKKAKDMSLENVLDKSISQTLSRSIMTSVTTFVVMIPLAVMGSEAIREFVVPLMIGVGTGCLSSIFICSPLYFDMQKSKKRKKKTSN